MTYLAAVLDLCIWAGEGFDGLDRWIEMPERAQSLWFEHWNNVRSGAYSPPPKVEKTQIEVAREAQEAGVKWAEMCRRNAKK